MATVTKNLKEGASAPLTHIGGHKMVAENLLDFSATGFNVAGSDVVQALIIPAGAIVTSVTCEVRTAEGGVATINIGDTADVDGWDAAVDANAAAGLIVGDGAYAGGKRYASESTIDVIPSADLDAAVIYISAEYYIAEL